MSIETLIESHIASLEANTVAVKELTAVWEKMYKAAPVAQVAATQDAPAPEKVTKVEKPKAEKTAAPAPTPPAPAAAPVEAAAPVPAAESPFEDLGEEVTLEQVQQAIRTKAASHHGAVVATLKSFGVNRGGELKPAQYAEFVAAVNLIGAE